MPPPTSTPAVIRTSEPGSFAQRTMAVRQPANIKETIRLNDFPPEIVAALQALRDELVAGHVRPLQEKAPDRVFWDMAVGPYAGRSWLDVPWYFAESFMFRRVLEATRYFQPGSWRGFDPFAAKKAGDLQPEAAPRSVQRLLSRAPADPETRLRELLLASLWGNQADLSYEAAARLARERQDAADHDATANLLVDDSPQLCAYLLALPELAMHGAPPSQPEQTGFSQEGPHIAVIADNAGTELLMDLALVDYLLGAGLAGRVDLHLKPQPFFVSDAMLRDVAAGLQALPAGGDEAARLAQRLWAHLDGGVLQLHTHWFYASSLFYHQMPGDLRQVLAACDLVLVKGDANYRRLLADAHWPPTTPFAQAVIDFPAPLAVLRTMKAELIAGLQPGQAEALDVEHPGWLTDGSRGVVQCKLDR